MGGIATETAAAVIVEAGGCAPPVIVEAVKPAGRKALVLALQHKEPAAAAKAAIAAELDLRRQLLEAVFPALQLGTQRRELAEGYQLKAEVAPRPKFSAEALKVALAGMAETGPLGAELALRLVAYKPEVRVGELKKLPADLAQLVDGVIVLEQGLAAVELVEP